MSQLSDGSADRSRRPAYIPYNQQIGARIKARRQELRRREGGWTQSYVADRLGIGREAFNHYESGRSPVPTESVPDLARVLGVSVDYILGTEDELTVEARDLVRNYEALPAEHQAAALGFVRELAHRYGSGVKGGSSG